MDTLQTVDFENPFDDVTVENALGQQVVEPQEEIIEQADDETPVEEVESEEEATPEEETPEEESEEEGEEAEEGESEAEDADKPKKVEGISEVRKALERTSAREAKLKEDFEKVIKPFEEVGAKPEEVVELVNKFGGVEQAKVGADLFKIITDNESDPNTLLQKAAEIIPDTIEALVLHVASEVEADLSKTYQTKLFGRQLTETELGAVRDFIDFGVTKQGDIPADLLTDEFGNPLPDKTQAAVRAMWERSKGAERQIRELSEKVSSRLSAVEDSTISKARDSYMADAFGAMGEQIRELGLDKAETKDDRVAANEAIEVLETLTLKFFSRNPAADRALKIAMETLGKKDAASRAKHLDATKEVKKFASVAIKQAAKFVAPVTSKRVVDKVASSDQPGAKELKGTGKTAPTMKRQDTSKDDWSDITVDNALPKRIARRR